MVEASVAEAHHPLRRILRNAASILIGDAAGELFAGYAVLLAATSLGPAGFGQISEAQAFMDPFDALAGLGLGTVAITMAAQRGACDGELRGTVWGIRGISAAIAVVLGLLASLATGRTSLLPLLVVIAGGMLLTPISIVSLLPFQFTQSVHKRIALPALVGAVRLGLAYAAYWLYRAPLGFQFSALGATIFGATLNYWWANRVYPTRLAFSKTLARELLTLGWPAAALEFIVMLYSRASYFFLHSAGPVVQGQYAAADRLMKPLLAVAGAVVMSSLPTVASLAARQDFAVLRHSYHRAVFRVAVGCVLLCTAAWFFAAWLLDHFAPDYRMAILPFRILSVGTVFVFLNMLSTTYIVALGRFRTIMVVAACNLVVYLVLAQVLIPKHQAVGAALATSLMEAVNTVVQLWIVSRLLKHLAAERAAAGPSS